MKALLLATTMLTFAGSARAQSITPGSGTITDSSGQTWSITADGSVLEGNTYVPGGGKTAAVTVQGGLLYGLDSTGRGWFTLSRDAQYWTTSAAPAGAPASASTSAQPAQQSTATAAQNAGAAAVQELAASAPDITTPTNCAADTAVSTGAFSVSGGQIIGPNGQPFIARGIDIMYAGNAPTLQQVQATFPGVNFIRLAMYDYSSDITSYVTQFTNAGIVVEPEDHQNFNADGSNAGDAGGSQGVVFTGSLLATELAWYSKLAGQFKGNPYVWFGTNNEPPITPLAAALSTWQGQTVQAIRGAGNNSIVMIEANCWAVVCNQGYTPSVYASMHNVIWDLHYYPWLSSNSTDQSYIESEIVQLAQSAQQITSADGIMPVLMGEYGDSSKGSTPDQGGTATVAGVINMGSSGKYGSAAWTWGPGNPYDGLTTSNSGGASSGFGQAVQLYVGTSTVAPNDCQVQQAAQAATQVAEQVAQQPETSVLQQAQAIATTPMAAASAAVMSSTYNQAVSDADTAASQAASQVAANAAARRQ